MVTTVKRFTQHEGYVTQATTDERLQSAVRDEMGRVARVRKVIHVQEGFAAESFVPLDRKTCTRIIRLFSEFQLSEQEASDEDFVLTMARSAARSLARAEDLVLLEGTRPARQHNVFKSGSVKLRSSVRRQRWVICGRATSRRHQRATLPDLVAEPGAENCRREYFAVSIAWRAVASLARSVSCCTRKCIGTPTHQGGVAESADP